MGKMNIYNSMKRRIAGALVFLALSGGSLFAQSGFRYPYLVELTDGTNDVCVIVSRDGKGGVKENLLRKAGDPAPDGTENETAASNGVAPMLEVASRSTQTQQSWNSSFSYCEKLVDRSKDDWRMPTQRELMLLYVMNDYLCDAHHRLRGTFYWCGTDYESSEGGQGSDWAWSVCFNENAGQADSKGKVGQVEGFSYSATNYIRCVRDMTQEEFNQLEESPHQ